MKKYILLFIVLILLVSGIYAGGQKESKALQASVIRFMTTETDPESVDADGYIIKSFEAKYPDVKVLPEYVTIGDAFEKAMLMVSADINPDLYYTNINETTAMINLGVLEPVIDVIKAIGDDFEQALLDKAKFEGKYYAVPTQSGSFLYWYRKDLAQKAGVAKPETRDDILNLVAKMTKDGMYGYTGIGAVHLNQQPPFYLLTWGNGDYIINEEGTKALFHTENRENSKKILKYLVELSKYAPPGFIGTGYTEAGADYINERAASLMLATRLPSWIVKTNPDLLTKTDAIPIPAAPGKKIYLWGGASYWVLFKNSKNIERSKDFIEHYMTGDRYAKFLKAVPMHLLPVRPKFINDPDYMADPIVKNFKDTIAMLMNSIDSYRQPATERQTPLAAAGAVYGGKSLTKNLNKLYAGVITIDECLDIAGKEFDRVLANY